MQSSAWVLVPGKDERFSVKTFAIPFMLQSPHLRCFIATKLKLGEGHMSLWHSFRNRAILVLVFALIVIPAGSVKSSPSLSPAAVIYVTTVEDEYNTDPAQCSLREAIWAAIHNVDFGGCTHTGTWGYETINLPAEEFGLSIIGIEDAGIAGDLDFYPPGSGAAPRSIQSPSAPPADITIQGAPDSFAIINAHGLDRVMHIQAGISVRLERLLITGGYPYGGAPERSGGGILNYGTLTLSDTVVYGNGLPLGGLGGGIFNQGTLTLDTVGVTDNDTGDSPDDTAAGNGGGIYNAGTMTANDSLISFNETGSNTGTGFAGFGAGIYISGTGVATLNYVTVFENRCGETNAGHGAPGGGIYNDGTMTINTSTISTNMAGSVHEETGDYNGGPGGGIFNAGGGELTITDSTIASNYTGFPSGSGASSGGGMANFWGGTATVGNTILADNFAVGARDCAGSFISAGYNLVESSGCAITGDTATNIFDHDPRLAPLAVVENWNYMHRLLLGSPAIDAGPATCGYIDQRHLLRPKDGDGDGTATCDIGAYEAFRWILMPLIRKP
jgi:CSLREA domain-containing protein